MTAVLGLDLGTQSTKASLVGLDGMPIGSSSCPIAFTRPRSGWAEQDPGVLEASAHDAIRAVLAANPGVTVAALSVAGQMGGAIGIDADFEPVTPHELWLDTRADADRVELLAAHGPEILAATGIVPFVAPRVRRWLRLAPELAGRLARVVAPTGYIAGRLTGARAAEAVCDRSQANMFGCFDARTSIWREDLAGRLGLPPALLPRIAGCTEIVGRISPDAAARSGLRAGTPVAAGLGDGTGGWLSAGGVRRGACIDTSGSSAHFAVTVDRFTPDPEGVLTCMPSAHPDFFYLLGFTTGTGLAHRWITTLVGRGYEELEAAAAGLEPGSGGLLAITHLNGRISPFAPNVKGAFVGIDDQTGPEHLYRSVLEAAAYEIGFWMEHTRRLVPDLAFARATNVGGGAQSALWNQIKADVTGIEFDAARPEVNASRGAALVAAAGIGAVALDDAGWMAPEHLSVRRFVPEPGRRAAYDFYRREYAALFGRLAPTYDALAQERGS